ncbi:TPA: hypothetical protein DEG75_01690 [Candidatus Dependentiae bacterium]|nr:hypothetical protein [Candidatus Dependentiae bacterium]
MFIKNIILTLSILSCSLSVVKAIDFPGPNKPPKNGGGGKKKKCLLYNTTNQSRAAIFSRQIPEYRDSIFRPRTKA